MTRWWLRRFGRQAMRWKWEHRHELPPVFARPLRLDGLDLVVFSGLAFLLGFWLGGGFW